MRHLLGQEEDHGAIYRLYRHRSRVRVQDQLAAVALFPVLVQVANQRDDPVGFATECVEVGSVEVPRAVMGQVAFEGKQAEKQLSVQVNSQRFGPGAPGRECRVVLIHPVDQVSPNEAIALLLHASADRGCAEVLGIDCRHILRQRACDIGGQPIR